MNQSDFVANTRNRRQERVIECEQVTAGFASH